MRYFVASIYKLWASFEQQTAERNSSKKIKIENNSSECGKP